MASLHRRADMGGKYELDYTDVDGHRFRVDTYTRDKKIAEVWLNKAEELLSLAKLGVIEKVGKLTRDIVAGRTSPAQSERLRLDDYEQKYLERGEHDLELAHSTLVLISNAFASFRGMVGNPYLDALTDEDVRRWKRMLAEQKRTKTTTAIYQRALKTAFTRAVKWKLVAENPFANVEMPSTKGAQKPRKSMDIEEVRLLLSVINNRAFKRYVQFVLYTACRRNEALYLKREDLDLEQRTLTVNAPKTHRRLILPINQALMRIIEEMQINGDLPESGFIFRSESNRRGREKLTPWHPSSVTHIFKEYLRLAGLPERYSLHSCRHTYVTHLRSKGIPQDVIQRLVGHSSPQTTDIYDHSDALFFRQFADLVDYEEDPSTASQ